ncbi:E3 ubiquitin-protein ligase RNF4 isoform X2 [Lagenorhynchus albirostris]|uniref:E3 ubiquitin-protein ligase RNF4 isoform X2 n=1 Tax=Lagenorhynchus albirostris TaxID=27610 RepID=UPI0028EC84A8|nr:E3 ubiquitin-protein ligase RNF4 isoform X2 [Lagenorhynchus albirostris]
MSTRKRRGGTVNSRQAQKRTREASSPPEMALEAEPIELVESAGDEIVDLTCESLEPVVVDLTHSDSVVVSARARRPRRNGRRLRQEHADSCVLSSDDEELPRDKDVYVTTHTPRNAREEAATGLRPSGTVSCPICMDGYSEVSKNKIEAFVSGSQTASVKELDERALLTGWAFDASVLQSHLGWHMAWHTSVKGEGTIFLGPTVLNSGLPCASVLCIPYLA